MILRIDPEALAASSLADQAEAAAKLVPFTSDYCGIRVSVTPTSGK